MTHPMAYIPTRTTSVEGPDFRLEFLCYEQGKWYEVVSHEPDCEGRSQATITQHQHKLYAKEYFMRKLENLIREHGL